VVGLYRLTLQQQEASVGSNPALAFVVLAFIAST